MGFWKNLFKAGIPNKPSPPPPTPKLYTKFSLRKHSSIDISLLRLYGTEVKSLLSADNYHIDVKSISEIFIAGKTEKVYLVKNKETVTNADCTFLWIEEVNGEIQDIKLYNVVDSSIPINTAEIKNVLGDTTVNDFDLEWENIWADEKIDPIRLNENILIGENTHNQYNLMLYGRLLTNRPDVQIAEYFLPMLVRTNEGIYFTKCIGVDINPNEVKVNY